ncbi:MAG: Na/Pi cotransporter family protein [Bacteroidetes bacterium]|jgi:phosphate:Na+ symporter|nr:Na/Pi cotransporter family protein [Bacteroidota bacterium]
MQQNLVVQILSLLGSISLFLFGMKLMSEGLQKVAAVRLRRILSVFTSTKLKSITTGFLITSLIQSSSATTVMIVSFVNAGLIALTESIAVILGANIGTTITAWLIFIFGFKFNTGTIALPLIGLAFPIIFSKNNNRQQWGKFLVGFSFIFLSLDFLKSIIPDISANSEFINFFANFSDMGFISVLTFFLIGALFTSLIQSSSAAMALTLVLVDKGWFNLELASAMILGENLGTTITANIAAIFANTSAKKAARSHFIINLMGILWAMLLFNPIINFINYITEQFSGISPLENNNAIPLALALFHSFFNVVNTLIFAPTIPLIIKLSSRLVKQSEPADETFTLKYFNTGILSTSELSILQARKKLAIYAKETMRMFKMVRGLFQEINNQRFEEIYYHIRDYEKLSDKYEIEIANYLTHLSEGELSNPGSRKIRMMLKIVDEIESIGDACNNIAKALYRKKKEKVWFTQELRNNINEMFDLVENAIQEMYNNLNKEYQTIDAAESKKLEKKINKFRKKLRDEHIKNLEAQTYKYQAGIIYADLFSLCEQMGDYAMNVTETIEESNRE